MGERGTRRSSRSRVARSALAAIVAVVVLPLPLRATAQDAPSAATTVASDFNGDGRSDVAIGAPGETIGTKGRAGAVTVLYSSTSGPSSSGNQLWHLGSRSIDGDPQTDGVFGYSLASGDINGDGFADLAVGAPNMNVGSVRDAGAVSVIFGSSHGLTASHNRFITQNSPEVEGPAVIDSRFGLSLASGDFNGDGFDDLAVGAPTEGRSTGAVAVLFGSSSGIAASGGKVLTQGTTGVPGRAEIGDAFGVGLAAGDVNGDGSDDLIIGSPNEAIGDTRSGSVTLLLGSSDGLTGSRGALFSQGTDGVPGKSEAGDRFGAALAVGDIDGDKRADVVVGIPDEAIGTATTAGAITTLYGASSGLSASRSKVFYQGVLGVGGKAEKGDRFGFAVAVGDVTGDKLGEVAVGAPGESIGVAEAAGAVSVLRGAAGGLATSGGQLLYQGVHGVPGTPGQADTFGWAVMLRDTNKDARADVLVGAPREAVSKHLDAGTMTFLKGSSKGVSSSGAGLWTQDSSKVLGTSDGGDLLGRSFAV